MKNESYLEKIDKIDFTILKVGDLLFDYYDCVADGRWLFVVNKTDTHITFLFNFKQIFKPFLLKYWDNKANKKINNGYSNKYRKYFIVTKSVTK